MAGGVMTLTLQRPDKKNALTGAMYGALSDALECRCHGIPDDPSHRYELPKVRLEVFD
jgi:hypothetical protein